MHRSCGAAGYRPSVVSTSLPHLAATGCGHLLLPFAPVRERLRDAVESFFDCLFDVFIEFTGLIRCSALANVHVSYYRLGSISLASAFELIGMQNLVRCKYGCLFTASLGMLVKTDVLVY